MQYYCTHFSDFRQNTQKVIVFIYRTNILNMTNRKDEKRKNALKKRRDIETLEFQVQWGLKKLLGDAYYTYTACMEAELNFIIVLNLYEDLLSIKGFVDDIRGALGVEPEPESGDFCHCLTAMALGIGKTNDICNFDESTDWQALLEKKILSIYYTAETRNKVFEYAKTKNYNTSTYLGQPIVKFCRLYIKLERKR